MKALRITTRAGAVRIMGLPPNVDLQEWWPSAKGFGDLVGNHWAMPFDMIALVDLIEMPDPYPDSGSQRAATPDEVAQAIKSGAWKPEVKA